jgi:O-antigen/teichoic acid export membrane protein
MLNRAVQNATFTTIGALANAVISFLFAGLTIRYLGDQRSGYLLSVQSVLALFGSLGGLGFGIAAIRKVAALKEKGLLDEARTCLGSVMTINLAVGFLVGIAVILGFPWIYRWARIDNSYMIDAFWASLFIAFNFLIQQFSSTYATVFVAFQRYDAITLLGTIFGLLNGLLGLLVLLIYRTMGSLALVALIIMLIQFAVNILWVRRLLKGIIVPSWNWVELRSMVKFGGWVWLADIGGIVNGSLDKVILTSFLGSASLPYYVVGQRMINQIHGMLANQSQFIFPMLAAKDDQVEGAILQVEDRLRWFVAFMGAVIYGALGIVAYPLLAKLVGPAFADRALLPFALACLQGFLVAQTIVPYQISWGEGRGAPNAVIAILSSLLTFSTIALLTPRMGVIGASLGQLWIGPLGLILVIWILLAGHRFHWSAVFRPIWSPLFTWLGMVGVGLAIFSLERDTHWIWILPAALGSLLVPLLGLLVEYWFFRKFRCIETLISAIHLFFTQNLKRYMDKTHLPLQEIK